ncbi:MAG: tRNA (adenosine(37)-N6)-threonylcarbamoyltransferase complex ATPase subunit type 1 TsaE [Clostridia bacterium]|nr:tRNA (adenosine(37)-N6)-threonylcarbamoyltransferase complex ATPase subunit type 1 TsaE [Clostridia bacterium]
MQPEDNITKEETIRDKAPDISDVGLDTTEDGALSQEDTPKSGNKTREALRGYFSATRISYIAIFTALAFVFYLLDFSILPAVPFLEIDFSNTFVMIAGFSLGPVAGVIVGVLKEIIHALTMGTTMFVGELANILFILPYVLIPSIIYKKRKGIKTVIVSLVLGSVAQVIVSIPVNWLLNFPAYMKAFMDYSWKEGMDFFLEVWYWALLFNVIKSVLISAAVLLIYKPLSRLIKTTNARFEKLAQNRAKKASGTARPSPEGQTFANTAGMAYNFSMTVKVSFSDEQTIELGKAYAARLKAGDVVLLDGEMGAGKTVFAKGVAAGLGIKDEITSPTYAYMNDYDGRLYHYDCYRLKSGAEAEGLGLTDYFYGQGVCLIEWSGNISSVLPPNCKKVTIRKSGENTRTIEYE